MGISDLLFVRKCIVCNEIISDGAVCSACDKSICNLINVRETTLETSDKSIPVTFMFDYKNPTVKKLIFALKQRANKGLFEYISGLCLHMIPGSFSGVVTNVPRRRVNCRKYGYDHVEKLCKYISRMSNGKIKYVSLLKRRGFSRDQKTLDSIKRVRNVKGKFKIKKKNITEDILLLDDVVTTGNTVNSCVNEILLSNPDCNVKIVTLSS